MKLRNLIASKRDQGFQTLFAECLIDSIGETFKNEYWLANFNSANADWLELKDNNQVLEELSKYIYSL